jgi:hypothetical protein
MFGDMGNSLKWHIHSRQEGGYAVETGDAYVSEKRIREFGPD